MRNSRLKQEGIGLIELMISITLGLFLLSGAIGVLYSTKVSYTLNSDLTWIQDNARFASSTVNRDIRMAGYFGCTAETQVTSALNPTASGTGWYIDFANPISGWDGDSSGYPSTEFPTAYNSNAATNLPTSDIVSIRRAGDSGGLEVVDNVPTNNVNMDVVGTHPYEDGDILVVTDCKQTTIFQQTGNNSNKLVYNTGTGSPGNCTSKLGPTACGNAGNDYEFHGANGATVLQVVSHAYYVSPAADGRPSLFRRELGASSGNAIATDEELVQGVENIQLIYGVDTDDDGYPNRYVNAGSVAAAEWPNVVTVRMHMLMRSYSAVASEPQTFRFAGNSYTPNDRFLRQEFISTIELRNRG